MHIRSFKSAILATSLAVVAAATPASALTTITFGKVTSAAGGHFDTKTGGVPAAVRQTAQKGWDNLLTVGIDETDAEIFCIKPSVAALYNTSITFTVMTMTDYVASGALTTTQGNLFAGWARAGTFGALSNAEASGLLYQAAGGAIKYSDVPTANFFATAAANAASIPASYFNMKNVKVYLSPKDSNGLSITQDYVSAGAVPEPTTWALMVAGFGMVGFGMRRRERNLAIVAS